MICQSVPFTFPTAVCGVPVAPYASTVGAGSLKNATHSGEGGVCASVRASPRALLLSIIPCVYCPLIYGV